MTIILIIKTYKVTTKIIKMRKTTKITSKTEGSFNLTINTRNKMHSKINSKTGNKLKDFMKIKFNKYVNKNSKGKCQII
jgi:hypothetical protein